VSHVGRKVTESRYRINLMSTVVVFVHKPTLRSHQALFA